MNTTLTDYDLMFFERFRLVNLSLDGIDLKYLF